MCFGTNAQSRKEVKYSQLVEEVQENGSTVDLITVVVGSKWFESFHCLTTIIILTSTRGSFRVANTCTCTSRIDYERQVITLKISAQEDI